MPSQSQIQSLIHNGFGEVKTPTKAAIKGVVWYTRTHSIRCPLSDIAHAFNVSQRSVDRIIATESPRILSHTNKENEEPSVRHHPRKIRRSDTAAIADLVDECSYNDKSQTWIDLALEADVIRTEKDIHERTIAKWMKDNEKMGVFVSAIARELPPYIKTERIDWSRAMLKNDKEYLRRIIWSDEFHFHVGLQANRRIKRRVGERYNPRCMMKKKITKPVRTKMKQVHVWVAVGYRGYCRVIPYDSGNSNGKMNSKTYCEILEQMQDDLRGKMLFEDCDSAHNSNASKKFKARMGIESIQNAATSPDFSVIESLVARIEDALYPAK
jgi:hypothetical protein